MYNDNGNYNSGDRYTTGPNYTNIGGLRIKPIYLYIGIGVAVLIALFLVTRFLNTGLVMHFSAYAGVLLLIANLRELLGQNYAARSSTALLNTLIAGGLIFAWLSQFVSVLMWAPAVLLLAIATPLAFGRASVYSAYVNTARSTFNTVRRTVGR